MREINVIVKNGNNQQEDEVLFFGPLLPDDQFHVIEHTDMPQILKEFGFFQSKGDARRNGWDNEIPWGFNTWEIGKKKRVLTILRPR